MKWKNFVLIITQNQGKVKQMKIKKALGTVIISLSMCALLATSALASELAELEEQRQVAESEVIELQEELTSILTEMEELQSQLIRTGEQIIQTKSDLELAEEDRQQQYEDMMLRIVHIYEAGTTSAIERILASGSLAEMLVQAEYVQTIHNHDRNMLIRFVETVETIEELHVSLEEDMAILEETKEEYKVQADILDETIEARSADIENLDYMIQEAIRIVAEQAEAARLAEEARVAEEAAAEESSAQETNNQESPAAETPPPPPPPPPPQPPPNVGDPGGNSGAAQIIVAAAHSAIGVPYVWGGSTMSGFDCSGLTMWAHAQAGISIPRTDITQLNAGRPVPAGGQLPGDIAWTPGHVAIYIGGGLMIEAQRPGTNVLIAPVRVSRFVRFW